MRYIKGSMNHLTLVDHDQGVQHVYVNESSFTHTLEPPQNSNRYCLQNCIEEPIQPIWCLVVLPDYSTSISLNVTPQQIVWTYIEQIQLVY